MSRPQIDGYAIVSREGMIANADGSFPKALKIDADQRFFRNALSQANAIANGRHSNEGGPEALARPRLVVTRRIDTLAVDTDNVKVVLWNPNGASFDDAWKHLGLAGGRLAIIGGPDVFGLFLDLGYDSFFLSRTNATVPNGRPLFPRLEAARPEDAIADSGLVLQSTTMLDATTGTTVAHWARVL